MKKLSDIVSARADELAKQYENKEAGREVESNHISTGLLPLDKLGLLEKGILTVVGGDPGSGKTAVALQLLQAAAESGFNPKAFFFEDPLDKLAERLIGKAMGVNSFKLRRIELDDLDVPSRLRSVVDELDWLQYTEVEDVLTDTDQLLSKLDSTCDEATGLVVIDYAQAFDAEKDERSVERVIARLAWGLNQLAKKKNIAVVLFSQLKTEVRERGNKWYENFRWKTGEEATETSYEAVEGFRPRSGDLQWSSALYQRAKSILYIFRPAAWLRTFGVNAKDDEIQLMVDKGNYGPNKEIVSFGWDGAQCRIYERKRGKK